MDYAAAYRDGIRMATHKATEGSTVRHAHYGEAMARARTAGIPYLGAYAVVRTPGNGGAGPVAAQVDHLLAYADGATPWWSSHPGWFWQVDLERWSENGTVYDAVAPGYGAQMADLLRSRTGRPVLLYAPRWAYGDTIPGGAPLWASDYGDNPAVPHRQAYPGDASPRWGAYSGRTPLVLQYGSRLTIGGQPGCDANAIRDENAWQALFGDDMDPKIEQALGVYLAYPYDGYHGVDPQAWAPQALERPLRDLLAWRDSVNQALATQAASIADIKTATADIAAIKAAVSAPVPVTVSVDRDQLAAALADPALLAALRSAAEKGGVAAVREVLGSLDDPPGQPPAATSG